MECKACGHKHHIWDGENCMITHANTRPFKAISGSFYVEEPYERPYRVSLHACPICGTVRIGN